MIASITGATGFIGSHLADALLEKGYTVRALVRKTSNLRWLEGKPIELIEGSMSDTESLKKLVEGADYVFHLAGLVKARTREEYFAANTEATKNLLDACLETAPDIKRFVFMGSQTAAGPAPSLDHPMNEDDPVNPLTRYGESKMAAEKIVREYGENIPYTILRAAAVYGPRDTEIYIWFKTLQGGLNSLIGFDDKRLSLIHSDDLVRGTVQAAESEKAANETYFLGSDEYYSWDVIGKAAGEIMGRKFITVRLPHFIVFTVGAVAQFISALQRKAATFNIEKARDFVQRYWICDTAKARRDFGYKQQMSLEEGLRTTVQWYREQGWLK